MIESEWLQRAIIFDLGTCIFYDRPVQIEARQQADGAIKWVLKMHEWVLGRDNKFHYEHIPSSRTPEFIDNTRFDSVEECHSHWVKGIVEKEKLNFK